MERSSDYNFRSLFGLVVFFLFDRHGKGKDGSWDFLVVKSELWNLTYLSSNHGPTRLSYALNDIGQITKQLGCST